MHKQMVPMLKVVSIVAKNQGSVRMGPISLFTLVIILCMATLSVLCIVTAQASYQMSVRQAEATTAAYENERAAQIWLAELSQGSELLVAENKASQEVPEVTVSAEAVSASEAVSLVNAQDIVAPSEFTSGVKAEFSTESGRLLNVVVGREADGSYRILLWKLTAVLNEEPQQETLWSGM